MRKGCDTKLQSGTELAKAVRSSPTVPPPGSLPPAGGFASLRGPAARGPVLQMRVSASSEGADVPELRMSPGLGTPGRQPQAVQPVCSGVA